MSRDLAHYDPEKLTLLLVKHHWRKQEFRWVAEPTGKVPAVSDLLNVRDKGGQFEWWNRGTDALLVFIQDGSASLFVPRQRNVVKYIVGTTKPGGDDARG